MYQLVIYVFFFELLQSVLTYNHLSKTLYKPFDHYRPLEELDYSSIDGFLDGVHSINFYVWNTREIFSSYSFIGT